MVANVRCHWEEASEKGLQEGRACLLFVLLFFLREMRSRSIHMEGTS